MKIVINKQYGGFNLSLLAIKEYLKLRGKQAYFYEINFESNESIYTKTDCNNDSIFATCFTKDFGERCKYSSISDEEYEEYNFNPRNIARTDKDLIEVVEKLGEKADSPVSTLKIIEIPDDVDWVIEEYDGNEWIAEKHRVWS